ncbi:MarR family winged helix-turn-helix transcriptional regulator [Clostridium bowmanii]|uniref:MarR family winged helix-turn-helix transcriptional regulator n=1 Tax=Clostridium bowmanii TaxID=132925 RepID=UPI001C0D7EF3|nr:MarR family winged helix-turn-helix transcriptional regulator [Clostridium bowmanii]MBU3188227.1 MarR family winged helix-turn-helix transcriptional regulator [Clostridium bowmanii]MCA1072613.1 MarR family winged helix-turn-helix transcriptional regulator [Clostridium bowmanii]
MEINIINSADAVGMFCRFQMNTKRDIPIRPSEMGVLIFTQKQSVPVTPLMISQFFKIAKPSVTSMINALVKHYYLTKKPSVIDKRSYTLEITEKGNSLVESTFVEYFKFIELLKEKMGENRFNQFIELIQIANGILDEVK